MAGHKRADLVGWGFDSVVISKRVCGVRLFGILGKFKSAVIAGDKAAVAEMTKFPLSMPYEVKAVKNKEDFLRRYDEIFKGEANAAQCFKSAEPQKESDRRYGIYCPFKDTPDDKENAPIRFIFELTKSGWRFVGLDNVNE